MIGKSKQKKGVGLKANTRIIHYSIEERMTEYQMSELEQGQVDVRVAGTATNLAPYAPCTSPSRLVMLGSQIQQKLLTKGLKRQRFFTGVEHEYAKYTFGVKVDEPVEIIAAIDKYNVGFGERSFKYNPTRYLFVFNVKKQEYDLMEVTKYCSHHNNFGFEFDINEEAMFRTQAGNVLQANTWLTKSPGVMPEGDYIFGTPTKTAFMSSHYVTEDGFMVSQEWCEENTTTGYGEIVINVPKGKYLTNSYGSKGSYIPFPGPGDKIRPDGLIASLRDYDDILGAVEMTEDAMGTVDHFFDERYYIEAGSLNARVLDVDIWCTDGDGVDKMPTFEATGPNESDYIDKFWKAKQKFHKQVDAAYTLIKNRSRGKPRLSRALHRFITDSRDFMLTKPGKRRYRYKNTPIPTVRIAIRFMYDIVPTIGFKLTNMYGGKGVICRIKPRSEMPTYPDGTVADFIGDGLSTINRMNPSVLFEHYMNYKAEEVEKKVRDFVDQDRWEDAFDILMTYYRAGVPLYYNKIVSQNWSEKRRREHVKAVYDDKIFAYMPPNTPGLGIEQIGRVEDALPSKVEHVTWIGDLGREERSVDPVMIGDMYIMVLEKTGHDWSAVDVPKRQVHGVPTKVSARDKHNLPYRQSPLRFFGEAEIRNYSGILGGDWAADMLDRANNPKAQEAIWKQVIENERPTDLDITIDRNQIPVGNSLSLSYLNNAMYCNGAQFAYAEVDTASDLEIEMLRKYPDPINRPRVSSLAKSLEEVVEDEDEEEYIEPEADYDDEGEEE
ncbi:hypothetical protein HAYMO_289 [Serratia phage vB_SmaM_Haymo]|nr:hypothetical protein HAYMO_289 [Serratia phage vB_SmaM_Haymo]